MKYDGLLFGNGLSLNLIKQIEPFIKEEKRYILNIDTFLQAFVERRLSYREENRIFNIFYKNKDIRNLRHFEELRNAVAQYYKSHDANIEYWLGVDLFKEKTCNYDFPLIKSLFPSLYNIWHEIMIDYLTHTNISPLICSFNSSVMTVLSEQAKIYTTNFDRLFEDIKPKHLHGIFIKNYRKFEELILSFIDDKTFYYKCIWGWNGIGKWNYIEKIRNIPKHEIYFDFDFFFNPNIHISNLLIYGMGFQTSGYIDELSEEMPKYKQSTFGGIVDEHILVRLNGLQTQKQLDNITFAYYADKDLSRYQQLVSHFNLKNVSYIQSSILPFSI